MTPTRPALRLLPERCDRCGKCIGRCKPHAIKLGPGYIYIDSALCDGCLACAEVCDRGAILPRERQAQSGPSPRPRTGSPERVHATAKPTPQLPLPGIWTPVDAAIALTVLLVCLIGVNLALGSELVRLMPPSGQVLARVAGLTATYAIELVVLWLIARRHDVAFLRAFGLVPVIRSARSAAASFVSVVGLFVGVRVVVAAYALATQAYSWEPPVDWSTDLTEVFGPGWTGLALSVLLAVLLGPFVEELVFRGVLLSALRERWSRNASIFISAVLFASYHFSLWMFAPIVVLGVALGWLADRRDGLWPPVALHVLYNGTTVGIAFWLIGQ